MVEYPAIELILGGQKSGKSRRAELLARDWLMASPAHRAVLVATGQAWDDEMRERIARHQADRAVRVPGMLTVEEPLALAEAVRRHSDGHTLVVVDCLTLWLTNRMMPADPTQALPEAAVIAAGEDLCATITAVPGPVVLVGNEIGLGVIPIGREVRAFVDALGRLNQQVAAACERVTLMAAGLPLTLKGHS
ncbi:MAG: adenosylcobinamide-phosphate guanylyltransferase [Comamonadaceae bacterium BICA1-1]|nr:MAG: adenosylcobinamide-phosphate guanylyltransferase [Comamonadaceae bacterium BICA1-1]KJS68891.1 MAG: adenosylcobinamide-phosphate guanylyltransferase [Comamonadaceae bacterium BICA1-1]